MTRPRRPSELDSMLDHAIGRLCDFLANAPTTRTRLRDWSVGVSSSSSGPGQRNAVSDPTGNQATNSADPFSVMRREIEAAIVAVHRSALDLERIHRLVNTDAQPPEPEQRGLAKCGNQLGCPDDAWAEKAGQCNACRTYFMRHQRYRSSSSIA